jgi:hypothetical protein
VRGPRTTGARYPYRRTRSANAVEGLKAEFRRANPPAQFPNEQAALKAFYLKAFYLTIREKVPNNTNAVGKINGWKSILNALTIHYGDILAVN